MLLNRINKDTGEFIHHPECSQSLCFCYALDERDYFIATLERICQIHNSGQDTIECSCNLCSAYINYMVYRANLNEQSTPSTH